MGTVRRAAGCKTLVWRAWGCLGVKERLRLGEGHLAGLESW